MKKVYVYLLDDMAECEIGYNFSDYVIMNPYDAPYDEYGKIIKKWN